MALLSTTAIVLGGIRLGEADRLITFFTTHRGLLKGVAKGARRMKSRFGASLEPFTHCRLIVFEKPADKLARINQCDIIHSFQPLREDWDGIERASRMVDLVAQMTPDGEANPKIFNLLLQGLSHLEDKTDPALSMLLFINRLIIDSGYQPRWDDCQHCHAVLKPGSRQPLCFSAAAGGALCPDCRPVSGALVPISQGTRAFLNASQKMDYARAHRLRPSPDIQRECGAIFKATLSYITGKSEQRFGRKSAPALHAS
ncbi:MAG: DNA repair protein RecO [Nitrospiria bacterium]